MRKILIISCLLLIQALQAKENKSSVQIEKLKPIAKKGDAKAQYQLGIHFLIGGIGNEPDLEKAIYWLRQSAEQNFPLAQYRMAICYEKGVGVETDKELALENYKKAANQGHLESQLSAGYILKGASNFNASALYFKMASERENVIALREYGRYLLEGKGIPRDPNRAMKLLTKAAKFGDAESQLSLALCYSGEISSIEPDLDEMIEHLWSAAIAGIAAAQSKLGFCYEEGIGVPKDTEIAVRWYQKAVSQGHPQAQVNLGHCYATGKGVPMDFDRAFVLYERASKNNLPTALYNMGVCFLNGQGVTSDIRQAESYFLRAGKLGEVNSQYQLGVLYESGSGELKPDLENAFYWYSKSAEQHYPRGLKAVARCYLEGIGTTVDEKRAEIYFQSATNISE